MKQQPADKMAGSSAKARLRRDRAAKFVVYVGGLGMIASIVGICVFLVSQALPLLLGASVEERSEARLDGEVLEGVVDPLLTHSALLDRQGRIRVWSFEEKRFVQTHAFPLGDGESLSAFESLPRAGVLAAASNQARVFLQKVDWEVEHTEEGRKVHPKLAKAESIAMDDSGKPLVCFSVQKGSEDSYAIVAQTASLGLEIRLETHEENAFTGEVERSETSIQGSFTGKLDFLRLDSEFQNLYGTTEDGRLIWWKIEDEELSAPRIVSVNPSGPASPQYRVQVFSFVQGERSLLLGQPSLELSLWFPVRDAADVSRMQRIRDFEKAEGRILDLESSPRNKSFLCLEEGGRLRLLHGTSGAELWRGRSPIPAPRAASFAPKGNAVLLMGRGGIALLGVENPHPETSLATLFQKVWYEGYSGPEYAWQSTGGSGSEPKLSMIPLIIGTLKGTLFSMLLSIPIAVLAAMYVSQFMHPSLQRYVKPVIEVMAAIPSVILGFVAALWLAPLVESFFTALLLAGLLLPGSVIVAGYLWERAPRSFRLRVPDGAEAFLFMGVLVVAAAVSIFLSQPIEGLLFGGDFPQWIRESVGVPFEQKNAVIVGLGMSFAVIPIIFSISEDAFSNVPKSLVAGSLALGADRWQTVVRVVLPTASPGIFSAIMVGLGRAVGETMIVLMATGNTAIMDWNPFNGFRALSANIAVEIPEAPEGGTLYRTLFVSGLLLFAFTFIINTVAEEVRSRLGKRYAAS